MTLHTWTAGSAVNLYLFIYLYPLINSPKLPRKKVQNPTHPIFRYIDVEYPEFDFEAQEIYMPSCVSCPPNYPWVGNPDGN